MLQWAAPESPPAESFVQWKAPLGAIALGVAFWLFPTYVKPHIEGWLFDDEADVVENPEAHKDPETVIFEPELIRRETA